MNKFSRYIKTMLLLGITLFSYGAFAMPQSAKHFESQFISYTDTGEGIPLILIHAFPTDQNLWVPQQQELKNHFRVITLDLWGFGHSASVDGKAVTMTDYADEVHQLMQQLHLDKAILAGESMGGYIALAFLEKYPDNLSGLVLSNTQAIADTEENKAKREASAVEVLQHGTTEFINAFMPKALSSGASDEMRTSLHGILTAQPATAMASALRGMALRHDTSTLLEHTSLPILIITGEEDILISSQQSKNMHQLAKNSTLVVLANAGHLSSLEQPQQWNNALIALFFNKSK